MFLAKFKLNLRDAKGNTIFKVLQSILFVVYLLHLDTDSGVSHPLAHINIWKSYETRPSPKYKQVQHEMAKSDVMWDNTILQSISLIYQ